MSAIYEAGRFQNIEDEMEVTGKQAMDLCCHICGEWLQWDAKVIYDETTESQYVEIKSGSCGEVFKLHIENARMEIVDGDATN